MRITAPPPQVTAAPPLYDQTVLAPAVGGTFFQTSAAAGNGQSTVVQPGLAMVAVAGNTAINSNNRRLTPMFDALGKPWGGGLIALVARLHDLTLQDNGAVGWGLGEFPPGVATVDGWLTNPTTPRVGWVVRYDGVNPPKHYWVTCDGTAVQATEITPIAVGNWLAITWEPPNVARLYVNGIVRVSGGKVPTAAAAAAYLNGIGVWKVPTGAATVRLAMNAWAVVRARAGLTI